MQKILQWYKKSTKNKIIVFSVIFILAFGYSFLHRPLGLIMWYKWNYPKEYEQMETKLYQVNSNEDKFLELYSNFYEKQNIDKRSKEIEKELLHYIDNLEIDLFSSSLVGLSELYLLAFTAKVNIYANDLEWKMAYYIFKPYRLTEERVQSYYDFLKDYNKFLFFVNRLDKNSYDANFITAKFYANFFVFKFIGHFLPLTEEKCFMKDDVLDIMQECYNELQSMSISNGMAKVDLVEKILDIAQYIYEGVIKEEFNECQ